MKTWYISATLSVNTFIMLPVAALGVKTKNRILMKHPSIPRCFAVTALLLTLLLVPDRVAAQKLVLFHADGTTTDVELYTMPIIQFTDDKVTVTSTVLDMEYPKENVLRFTYRGSADALKQVRAEADYSLEDGQLVFHGISQTDDVAVYNASGVRVTARLMRHSDSVSLSLAYIPAGVYVLSVNGKTSKFTKR